LVDLPFFKVMLQAGALLNLGLDCSSCFHVVLFAFVSGYYSILTYYDQQVAGWLVVGEMQT